MEIGLTLEIENEVEKLTVYIINGFTEKVFFEHAGWPCKGTKPAGAFRAAEIQEVVGSMESENGFPQCIGW